MLRKLVYVIGSLILLWTVPTFAQTTGPNGGLVGGTGSHQVELVVSSTELTVYLLEHGKIHETKAASFRAVVQQGGKTTTINLVDQDGKRMVGKLDDPLQKGAIVVVAGKDHHGDRVNARFVIK
jgi:hypothetical protein